MRVLLLTVALSAPFSTVLCSTGLADGRVIEIDGLEPIVGDVQRPAAFYVLERHDGRAEVVDLRTTFTDEIVRDAASVD